MSEKTATATPAKNGSAKVKTPKSVYHEVTISVKAPGDMPASRVQRAIQHLITEGLVNLPAAGVAGTPAVKIGQDINSLTISKAKLVRKDAPVQASQAAQDTSEPAQATSSPS